MVNELETLGVIVNDIKPKKLSKDNSIDNNIEVIFNADIKIDSLYGAIKLYKNLNKNLIDDGKDIIKGDFKTVDGCISYSNRVIKFTPSEKLDKDSCYTVFIKEGTIKDVNDNTMLLPFVSHFFTNKEDVLLPPSIINPKNGETLKSLDSLEISSKYFSKYRVEISTNNKFSTLIYANETIAVGGKFEEMLLKLEDLKLSDNNYYIRVVEVENSLISDPIQIEINNSLGEEFKVSEDDFSEVSNDFNDSFIDGISLINCFPKNGALEVSTKINHLYAIVDGLISKDDIEEYLLVESPFTEESDELDTSFNNFIHVEYDDENNQTKIYYKFRNESDAKNYGSEENLSPNQLYNVSLIIRGEEINWYFVSKITPKYCTINQVRLEGGAFISEIDDIEILRKIHSYSAEALEEYEDQVENNIPSRELKRWVKYKVLIDVCNTAYLSIASKLGSNSKAIGDISIKTSGKLPYLSEIMKKFKEDLQDAEDGMSEDSKFTSTPRAGNTTYPLDSRVGF